ncbi:TPA: hypothetical protein NM870_003361 [Acinetobacter baumannii]|nr:hypothetical protein [Acinetobacter baumannii]
MSYQLTVENVIKIVNHWLSARPNGYIGVNYGRNWQEILLKPMTEDSADLILQWMREDIPLFRGLPTNTLNIKSRTIDIDKKEFFIEIGSILIPLPSQADLRNPTGDTYDANAG